MEELEETASGSLGAKETFFEKDGVVRLLVTLTSFTALAFILCDTGSFLKGFESGSACCGGKKASEEER